MKKADEAKVETSCWNKALSDELVFVLLERDECAADTIRYWCRQRIMNGNNDIGDKQITEAMALAEQIDQYHEQP